ncbi:MAG: PepSY-like domain-containing protein [Bacteroidota bacterium]|nr:PepSY-like domain-containing protein [Bacteroidota bacterium]
MKKTILGLGIFVTGAMVSCKKDNSAGTAGSAAIQQAAVQQRAIAIAASTTTAGDSIYVIHTCGTGDKLSAVDFSALPSTVTDYLGTNYAGYTAVKAFDINNSAGTLNGYIAIIQYNGNPVGIKFDASGNFVEVLEQREGRDLLGSGWHHGGCFDNRDAAHRDTIAISSLPAAIQTYLATNYPQDTLLHAFIKRNGDYIVISTNNGLFATIFTSSGSFITHVPLAAHNGQVVSIDANALPGAVTNYLTATYPGYVFEKAFSYMQNGLVKDYLVIIDSNNTKYGLLFDATGTFIGVKVIR